jgi:cysteine-rich repeat protein
MENGFWKGQGRLVIVGGVCTLLILTARSAPCAVDLTGEYRADLTGFVALPDACTVSATQVETSLSFVQSCLSGTYTGIASGSIDPATGVFSVSGQCDFSGVLEPYILTGTGAPDSLSFVAAGSCGEFAEGFFATKCGNSIADALEECEDGNRDNGDCCSAICQLEAAGQVCDGPITACTFSACDGAGSCLPGVPSPAGTVCDLDADLCTTDECNGAGSCQATGQTLSCDACSSCDPAFGCVGDVKPQALSGHDPDPGACAREHIRASKLVARNAPAATRDQLTWVWKRGFALDPADFGDPINATSYRLCGFQRASFAQPYRTFAIVDLSPGSDWSAAPNGFKLRRRTSAGAARLMLRGSPVINKPQIRLSVQGEIAGFTPVFEDGAGQLVLQLSADNGKCWSSVLFGSSTDKLIKAR